MLEKLASLGNPLRKLSAIPRVRPLPFAIFGGVILAFVLFGGLAPSWAFAALAGTICWTILQPETDTERKTTASPGEPTLLPPGGGEASPLWQQVLQAVTDPALILDYRQNVVLANAGAQALLPVTHGRHISQVHRDPTLLSAIDRALASRQPQSFDIHMLLPVERHLVGTATPLTSDAQRSPAPALLIQFRDHTEAEQLAQMRADFVANASHELRTPLASLKGFVETLQGAAKDDPKAREQFLGIMQSEAARMSRLIDDLLSLSRIEMHEHLPPTGKVDVARIAAEAAASLGPLAQAKKIDLRIGAASEPMMVTGDEDELAQLAQNIIQNGIKYGKTGGQVEVTVRREDDRVALEVADDGIGIAAQHLPRLTERFYRVSAKESRERGGTGLGLAIVKHIVNRHRGELRIRSVAGQGSTFTILLPVSAKSR